jgi:transposase-like protein
MVHSYPETGRRHCGASLHRGATTTEAVRRAIQHSQESLRTLARRHGINPKTVAKWRKRCSVTDLRTGPKHPRSTVLTVEQEAIILAFRKHTLLPLDDCLYALQVTIPHLTRSSLNPCLERHAGCGEIPPSAYRGCPLSDPYRAHGQRHPVRRSAEESQWDPRPAFAAILLTGSVFFTGSTTASPSPIILGRTGKSSA